MNNTQEIQAAVAPGQKPAKSSKNSLVEHAGLLLGATLIAGVTNYLFHILMSRSLGPLHYGVLYSLLSLFMIFAFPLSTVQMVLTKYVAVYRGQGNDSQIRYLYHDFFKKLGIAGIVLLGLLAVFSGPVGTYLQIPARAPIVLLGIFTFLSFLMPVVLGMLQGLEHFFYLSLNQAVGALSKLLIAVGLVTAGYQVSGALGACVLSVLVTFLLAWFPVRRYLNQHQAVKVTSRKEVYEFFIPVFAALSFYGLLAYQDVVLVKHWFAPEVAGAYATAALLGKAFLFPAQSLAMAMFPKVSQAHAKGEETFSLLRHTLFLALLVLGAGLAVTTFFPELLGKLLMKRENLTGEAFTQVVRLIRNYPFAYIPVAASYILMFYFLGCHQKRFVLVIGGATVLFLGITHLMHPTIWHVLSVMGGISSVLLVSLLVQAKRIGQVRA